MIKNTKADIPNDTVIDGDEYLRIATVAQLSGVSVRTLQRWISDGELDGVLTIYQDKSGVNYYRLGQPYDDDCLIEGSVRKYKMREVNDETI